MRIEDPILKSGLKMPKLGLGTWHMGEDPNREQEEIASIRLGVTLGLTLLDTAEMYGNGGAERMLGKAITPFRRQDLFIVSKALPQNASRNGLIASCEASLRRLGTDYLDLYLLHWRGETSLRETVEGMEELIRQEKIRDWGVSNFDVQDMHDLWQTGGGANCSVNQILYHLGSRGTEYDLLPWLRQKHVVAMAYCPLAQGGTLRRDLLTNPVVLEIAQAHHISVYQLLLAFVMYQPDMAAIPKAACDDHVKEIANVVSIDLDPNELARLNAEFPAPDHKVPLDIE